MKLLRRRASLRLPEETYSLTGDAEFDEMLDKCLHVLKTKSLDYAEEGDRLAEFRRTAKKNGVTMRQVWGIYTDKHLESIDKWKRGQELLGEPVEDKLMDIIVYCLLAYKMVKEEK